MTPLDLQFLEAYKQLDRFCTDAFSPEAGQSGVRACEEQLRRRLPSFHNRAEAEAFADRLDELRRLRNSLVHDPNPPFCREQDLRDVQAYYERFLERTDPLSELERERRERLAAAAARREQQKREASRTAGAKPVPGAGKGIGKPAKKDRSIPLLTGLFFLMVTAFLVLFCIYLRGGGL